MQEKELKLGKYRHFKGKLYEVIGVARNSENSDEEFVVYKALYNDEKFGEGQIWIRPKQMFLETVNIDGKDVKRFEFIEEI